MPKFGIIPSHADFENGMTMSDMEACVTAADKLDEVIIFRSTGPWSQRWIARGYPTKNFHVKGKSSDWGPQAGFVPYLGKYSKVGADETKAQKGTDANDDGLKHSFAAKRQLELSQDELNDQLTLPCESPPRTALSRMEKVAGSGDYLLWAKRSGDGKLFAFRAVRQPSGRFAINVYPDVAGNASSVTLAEMKSSPLEVMTSGEVGAGNQAMTGDYDLMAVCPRWGNYGSTLVGTVSKPGLNFTGKGEQPGQTFHQGANLDKVLDMTSNTGQVGQKKKPGFAKGEHGDMGNITPRILRCINTLNTLMGANGPFRRVHHNAESHRNAAFGALKANEMEKGEGMPLTAFLPASLVNASADLRPYTQVCTLLTMQEFRHFAGLLHQGGFFVPRNWTWGMSIRDRA